MNKYQASITLWKAFWQFVIAFAGTGTTVLAISPPETYDDFKQAWPALALPVVFAIWRAYRNWAKQHDVQWKPFGLPILILACMISAGCVSTGFRETVSADGVTTTEYKAMSAAWPFGEIDTTNHEFGYKWDKNGGDIQTGQDAQGIDNTGMTVVVPVIEKLLDKIPDPVVNTGPLDVVE